MKIFKFGGASIKDVEHIQHFARIIEEYKDEQLLLVISAMGKTTNSLEKMVESHCNNRQDEALHLFNDIRKYHITMAKYLLVLEFNACIAKLAEMFTEMEWLLRDEPTRAYNYYYDQLVCMGELMSTTIISAYLREKKINNTWLDVRDVIRTNAHFREALVDWEFTEKSANYTLLPLYESTNIVLTQGFIGCTANNESTTLGREGSDYTAAIFANIFHTENLTIWKDVEGVMNADPKFVPEAKYLPHLNYAEVVEMAYYGAQVIHPKTIKPLQNKNIPLYVKCFLDTGLPGTIIDNKANEQLPPIIILKKKQALLTLRTPDFSFIEEKPMTRLYKIFNKLKIKPNLIQTGAISIQVSVDDTPEKIDLFGQTAGEFFDVQISKDLALITIRHYDDVTFQKYLTGKERVIFQQDKITLQVLYKEEPKK